MVVMNKRGRRSYVDHSYSNRHKPSAAKVHMGANVLGSWSDEQDAYLKEICTTALSYGTIMMRFNEAFPDSPKSRSAVLARASRKGYHKDKPMSSATPHENMLRTRAASLARTGMGMGKAAGKRVYDKRIKVSKSLAPVVFRHADPVGLRSDEESRVPRLRSQGRGHAMRKTPEQVAKARMGQLPCIVEDKPLTSRPLFETERDTCKWPTSESVRDMEVCGAEATIGAYCERHGQIAYREMPTVKRNRIFHKDNEEYRPTTKHAPAAAGVKNGSELYRPTLATLETSIGLLEDAATANTLENELLPNMIGLLDE